MAHVTVIGAFDRLQLREIRLLQEAARQGPVQVQLWSDQVLEQLTGAPPAFPLAERLYVLDRLRYVDRVTVCEQPDANAAYPLRATRGIWVLDEQAALSPHDRWCRQHGWQYQVVPTSLLETIPDATAQPPTPEDPSARRVIVTGCYDWFHSGHVRFFEEVSQYGQLHVVVGHDANIQLLKGEGHPLFPAAQRRYIVGSVRHVHQAYVSSGEGWLDAQPEIERIRPHIYAVNEDGDRPEKRQYCAQQGIEYLVLQRRASRGAATPAEHGTARVLGCHVGAQPAARHFRISPFALRIQSCTGRASSASAVA